LVLVPDDLERRFRFGIVCLKGGRKGGLSKAMAEAMEDWLKKHDAAITRGAKLNI
jgi:hypothetical protein